MPGEFVCAAPMQLSTLHIRGLRCLADVALELAPGLNLLTGDNGAGKSSVLEAVHLLAYGRSFRGRVRDGLVRSGSEAVEVFARWQDAAAGRERRIGLWHDGRSWRGKLDGENASQLGELCAALAVVTFEPGSHALIDGAAEIRRRFLDWGLFHVEQDFHPLWRRYARALKQRNALLKQRASAAQLDAWDQELAEAGELLARHRDAYVQRLQQPLQAATAAIAPTLGRASLRHLPGWRREQLPLADALLLARGRDQDAGFTSVGPHRGDWRLEHDSRPAGEALSRGQGKLAALSCLLAQAEDFASQHGLWPVMQLDDLAAELDHNHQQRLLQRLADTGAQVLVTGTSVPSVLQDWQGPLTVFHVEHGAVQRLSDSD